MKLSPFSSALSKEILDFPFPLEEDFLSLSDVRKEKLEEEEEEGALFSWGVKGSRGVHTHTRAQKEEFPISLSVLIFSFQLSLNC